MPRTITSGEQAPESAAALVRVLRERGDGPGSESIGGWAGVQPPVQRCSVRRPRQLTSADAYRGPASVRAGRRKELPLYQDTQAVTDRRVTLLNPLAITAWHTDRHVHQPRRLPARLPSQ